MLTLNSKSFSNIYKGKFNDNLTELSASSSRTIIFRNASFSFSSTLSQYEIVDRVYGSLSSILSAIIIVFPDQTSPGKFLASRSKIFCPISPTPLPCLAILSSSRFAVELNLFWRVSASNSRKSGRGSPSPITTISAIFSVEMI